MYNLPEGYKDIIVSDTEIHLDLMDRLRVLFGAKLTLRTRTYCENLPGKVYSDSDANVYVSRRRKPPQVMMEAKDSTDA